MKEHPSNTERAKQVETIEIGDSILKESTTVILHDRTISSSQLDKLTTSKGDNTISTGDTLNEKYNMSSSSTSSSSLSSSTTTTTTATTRKSKTEKSSTSQLNSKKIAQELLSAKPNNITASIPAYATASQRKLFTQIQEHLERNRRPRNNKDKLNNDVNNNNKKSSNNKGKNNIVSDLFSNKNNKKAKKKSIPSYRPDPQKLDRLSYDEAMKHRSLWDKNSKKRDLGDSSSSSSPYNHPFLADTSTAWDWWQQAYRMLGGYIDCDHHKDDDDNDDDGGGCSRWMIWAAYVDPNYEGGGYDEYIGDSATGTLDCHTDGTEWKLVGVYRQEFYQFIEQISKHIWAFGDWEYIATCASLAYMTDYDCFQVSYTDDGSYIYAGVQPTSGGYFQMALYTDENCLYPQSLGVTYDDMGYQSDLELDEHHSGDDGNYDDDAFLNEASEWWYNAQEYTLSDVNQIFDTYKKCTLCMDYPTYQDGFYNGDTGYDEDDLINQCWKFYSHDTFTCETDCLSLASAQGSITAINYGNYKFGGDFVESSKEFSSQSASTYYNEGASETEKLKANAFLTLTGIMFIATFLAFGIARGSISGKSRKTGSSSSRRGGGDDDDEDKDRRKRRSRSRGGGDARSTRSKSKSSGRHRSKSNSRRLLNDDYDYEEERSRSSRKRRSSSRKSKSGGEGRSSRRSGERKSSSERKSGRNSRSRSGGGSSVRRSASRGSRSRERGYYEPPETAGAAAPEPFSSNATASSRRSRRNRAAESSEADRERRYRDDF